MPTAIKHLSDEDKELYINIIKTGTEIRNYIRIVILGENGVGKTCLLRRLLKQSITGVQSTDGIDMHRCKIQIKDGQWVFDEVSDKKKALLARIKTASQPITVEDETLQQKDNSLKASGLQDDDGSQNINREAVGTSLNISVRKRKTIQDKLEDGSVKRRKRKDQSFTTIHNASQDVEVDSQSPLKHNNTITKLLTDKVIQGLDDFLDGIEKVDVPADKFVECGILDFAGEKEYYATHPVFLNPNALHILVTNIMKDVKPITTEVGFDKIGGLKLFKVDKI